MTERRSSLPPTAARSLLLDIEGTTSPIAFVHDVMFPFAARALSDYLDSSWRDDALERAVGQLARDLGHADAASWLGEATDTRARREVEREVRRLMDADIKATGLKELQGLIWKSGFESGELCAPVFDDVLPAIDEWRESGREIGIYSSGSVAAQKLFFGHTTAGNVLDRFSIHFDTTVGGKKDEASYRAIASSWERRPADMLFLSDVVEELDAAAAAGLPVALLARPGNATPPPHSHPVIRSFAEVVFA